MKTPLFNSNLFESIATRQSSGYVISDEIKSLTHTKFLEEVSEFKAQFTELEKHIVAIDITQPLVFIQMLCLLDGFASAIVILPAELTSDQKSNYMADLNVNFHLSYDGGKVNTKRVSALFKSKILTSKMPYEQTKWILATSGTTGLPKFVTHTFASITAKIQNNSVSKKHVWGLLYSPHRFAGLQVVLQSLIAGNHLVIASSSNMTQNIEMLSQHNVNSLSATPSMWRQILMTGIAEKLPLKVLTLGGEIADQQLLTHLSDVYPHSKIRHIYASTEFGIGFSVSDGCAGFPLDWLNDPLRIPRIKLNEEGHLLIESTELKNRQCEHLAIDDEGYVNTGDVMTISADRVIFMGRENGVINVGGNKVFPEMVEDIIRQCENIADVCVYSQKNAVLGQIVVADIVLQKQVADEKLFKQQLITQSKKSLSKHQVPMLLFLKQELEVTAADKLARRNN